MKKIDKNRSSYYNIVSGKQWGKTQNYDLCIDSLIRKQETADIICEYVKRASN
ncbi:MAG: cytidylate kinase family protein [Clostridia bacterium]|nr:cytidylate kinase family protein [Clostridia bacterium]